MYDEAIKDYSTVLAKLNNHIPTLKGLGETYYLLAKQSVEKSINCEYVQFIETGIDVIILLNHIMAIRLESIIEEINIIIF